MASRDEIRKAILKVAGNPESGVIREMSGAMADAVVALDATEVKSFTPVSETRVMKASEKR